MRIAAVGWKAGGVDLCLRPSRMRKHWRGIVRWPAEASVSWAYRVARVGRPAKTRKGCNNSSLLRFFLGLGE